MVGTRRDGHPTRLAWQDRPEGIRTITTLNTGAGDDHVTVAIDEADGFLVVNLGDGDDTLAGGASALGFVAFGGPGNDDITTGSSDDIVFGDEGRVQYGSGATILGDERLADVNDGVARRSDVVRSLPMAPAAPVANPEAPSGTTTNNRIAVGDGDDIAWGGLGNAWIEAAGGRNAPIGYHADVWRERTAGPITVTRRDGFNN